jgi:hypothetical protein
MFLAVLNTSAAADRLHHIPSQVWEQLGIAVLALIIAVIVLRKIARANKVVMVIVVLFAASMVGFNWIYERNEPQWATPAVSFLSGWFPSKGKIEQKGHGT